MRLILVLRGLASLFFAALFLTHATGDWNGAFDVLPAYLLVDGVGGVLLAGLLFRDSAFGRKMHLATLAMVLGVDGIGRISSAIALMIWPGISGFPVTAVTFIALMAVFTAMVGFTEAVLIGEEDVARYGRRHARPEFAIPPVLLSAIASAGFGVAAFYAAGDMPVLRRVLAGYAVAAAAVMFAMAWTRRTKGQERLQPDGRQLEA